jgi:hypothetical protein
VQPRTLCFPKEKTLYTTTDLYRKKTDLDSP